MKERNNVYIMAKALIEQIDSIVRERNIDMLENKTIWLKESFENAYNNRDVKALKIGIRELEELIKDLIERDDSFMDPQAHNVFVKLVQQDKIRSLDEFERLKKIVDDEYNYLQINDIELLKKANKLLFDFYSTLADTNQKDNSGL